MLLPGFTGSSSVSVSIEPNASQSTITLGSAYQLQIHPLFDRFGRLIGEIPLSVPTRCGFYTSKISLECLHASRDVEVILGSDWISVCSVTFCEDGSGLEDPSMSVISSLPIGNYWSPNSGVNIVY